MNTNAYSNYARIRDRKGMKDIDVAKASGVPQPTLSEWKAQKYTPKIDKIQAIAKALDVDVMEIIGE